MHSRWSCRVHQTPTALKLHFRSNLNEIKVQAVDRIVLIRGRVIQVSGLPSIEADATFTAIKIKFM